MMGSFTEELLRRSQFRVRSHAGFNGFVVWTHSSVRTLSPVFLVLREDEGDGMHRWMFVEYVHTHILFDRQEWMITFFKSNNSRHISKCLTSPGTWVFSIEPICLTYQIWFGGFHDAPSWGIHSGLFFYPTQAWPQYTSDFKYGRAGTETYCTPVLLVCDNWYVVHFVQGEWQVKGPLVCLFLA